jgi:hypothetical protein
MGGKARGAAGCVCVRVWEGGGGAGCAQCCRRRPRHPPRGPCSPRRRARPSPAGHARPCGLFGARGLGADPPVSGRGRGGMATCGCPLTLASARCTEGSSCCGGARAFSGWFGGELRARFDGLGVRWRMPEGRFTVGTCVGETQGEGCVWQESPRAREHRPPAGPSLALAATASDCPAGFVRGRVSRAAPAKRRCGSDLYGKGGSAGGRTSASAPPSLWKPMEAVTRSLESPSIFLSGLESASIFLSGFCSGGFFALRGTPRRGTGVRRIVLCVAIFSRSQSAALRGQRDWRGWGEMCVRSARDQGEMCVRFVRGKGPTRSRTATSRRGS